MERGIAMIPPTGTLVPAVVTPRVYARQPAVVVVGASGFVGRGVVRALDEAGFEAIQVDRSHGIDIRDQQAMNAVDPGSARSVVVLSQSPLYRHGIPGHREVVETNILGVFNILEWAVANQLSHLVLVSSASVYRASEIALTPGAHTPSPESLYGTSKLAAEIAAAAYAHALAVTVVRPFLVYGCTQATGLIPRTLNAVHTGQVVELARGLGPLLSPVYVEDLVRILTTLAVNYPPPRLQTLDVPGPDQVHLLDVVQLAARHWSLTPEIRTTSSNSAGYASAWHPPVGLQALLDGQEPRTRIKRGLQQVLNWIDATESEKLDSS